MSESIRVADALLCRFAGKKLESNERGLDNEEGVLHTHMQAHTHTQKHAQIFLSVCLSMCRS